jgi:hypothetical protein
MLYAPQMQQTKQWRNHNGKNISFIGSTDTYIEPVTMATAVAMSAATVATTDSG